MRIAALSDVHGNLPALRAVLADVAREQVDAIVFGGDVAAGPLPAATIDELIALGDRAQFVRGNADWDIVEAYDEARLDLEAEEGPPGRTGAFCASRIARRQRDFLAGFDDTVVVEIDGLGPTLFCHGSPRSDTEIITTATSDERLRSILDGVEQSVIVTGHTHRQFDRRLDRWRIVNTGAVGMPYEGHRGAYWALLGPDIELRRTDYDLEAALPELAAGNFPDLDEMLKESLLEPIDPDEVAEFFERQALGAG
jgi:predicted phosphodiesterase